MTTPFLSFCLIAKNEADELPRCLSSVAPYVDELIVVDTGSTDDTCAIAASFQAKVFHFDWIDDFSAAKNYAIAQASGQWILMLDADEEWVITDSGWRDRLLASTAVLAYLIPLSSSDEAEALTPMMTPRLFRADPALKYRGRYHESLRYQGAELAAHQLQLLPSVGIRHYGYAMETLAEKSQRRILILEKIRTDEGLSLMLLWTLSGMYECLEDLDNSLGCYLEALERLMPDLEAGTRPTDTRAVRSWLFSLGVRSLQAEDFETVQMICSQGLDWFSDFPPLHYLTGLLLKKLGFSLGAMPYFETCLGCGQGQPYFQGEPFDRSLITTQPACELGKLYFALGNKTRAIAAFETALKFDPNYPDAIQGLAIANTL
jgi:glycosyltransferase involved in cell wall biosynthesis